jgi:hypothetical protein
MADDHMGLLLTLKHIFFTNILARTLVAKAHNAGMFYFHVNKFTKAYLDWFYAAVFEHCKTLIHPRISANVGRIKVCFSFLISTHALHITVVMVSMGTNPVKSTGLSGSIRFLPTPNPRVTLFRLGSTRRLLVHLIPSLSARCCALFSH